MLRMLAVLVLLCATAVAAPSLQPRIEGTHVEASVRGAPLPTQSVTLQETSSDRQAIAATSVRGFAEGGPAALVFVLYLSKRWDDERKRRLCQPAFILVSKLVFRRR